MDGGDLRDDAVFVMVCISQSISRMISRDVMGVILAMTYIFPPEKMPAPPQPVMARPMMKMTDEGAVVQSTEPRQNMKNEVRKTDLREKMVYDCPKTKMVEMSARILGMEIIISPCVEQECLTEKREREMRIR